MLTVALARAHERDGFTCGVPELDDYLKRFALQNQKKGISRAFVALQDERIVGYYTISASHVEHRELPVVQAKKLPSYPVPVALIGRLAVANQVQGQGLGRKLLVDACYRIVAASREIGCYAVLVDAKDDRAGTFYRTFGFMPLTDQPLRLFLPLSTLQQLFGG